MAFARAARPNRHPGQARREDSTTGGAPSPRADSVNGSTVSIGRPPWWLLTVALLVALGGTLELLVGDGLEQVDTRLGDVIGSWGLRDSPAYPTLWLLTQLGGRVTILLVLGGLVTYLAWRHRTLLPLARVLIALALLTAVVYGLKYGTGRTAPSYPGSYFYRGGESFPSGHVANAVLMWGVARWQAVEFGLSPPVQRTFAVLAVAGPVATGAAMLSLNFHWLTDALIGGAIGLLLLRLVHSLDSAVLCRLSASRVHRQ